MFADSIIQSDTWTQIELQAPVSEAAEAIVALPADVYVQKSQSIASGINGDIYHIIW